MEKPLQHIEALTREIAHFRDDYNDHKADTKEWQSTHEQTDWAALGDLKESVQGLYSANREMARSIEKLIEQVALLSNDLKDYKASNEDMIRTWESIPLIKKIVITVVSAIIGVAAVGAAVATIKSWFN